MKLEWNLDYYMRKNQLSIQDVADLTGLHRNIISRIKNNKQTRIDMDTLERLIFKLNIQPNELFRKVESFNRNDDFE